MTIPQSELPRVVVIGAGFAGIQIAKHLNTKSYQLVIIDKNNYHTFQPLLYQVASAGLEPDSIAYPVRKILRNRKNAYFRYTHVDRIDLENNQISTDIGAISYDILVIATGATNNFFGNTSIEVNALPMKSLVDALDLRSKILGNFEKALNTSDEGLRKELMNFVIVGAGPTGVELAGALAELKNKILPKDFPDLDFSKMNIYLIEAADRVLPGMESVSSIKAQKYLEKLGVTCRLNTFVNHYETNHVYTSNGEDYLADTLIWAAGVAGIFPDCDDSLEIGKGNRIIVDGFLSIPQFSNTYVLGDAGFVRTEKYPDGLPMVAAVAMQQGQYLAKMLNRKAKDKSIRPFDYNDKGTMATIGRNKAVVELGKLKIQGLIAWFIWMFVHLMLLVGFRNRVVVFINWAWNYVKYNNGLRLIVRPFHKVVDRHDTVSSQQKIS